MSRGNDRDPAEILAAWRSLLRDGHHQLDQEEAVGNLAAQEEMAAIARRSGVPENVIAERMRLAYVEESERLSGARRSWWRRRRRTTMSSRPELPSGSSQRWLPPGE
jgi:hypothetical protein